MRSEADSGWRIADRQDYRDRVAHCLCLPFRSLRAQCASGYPLSAIRYPLPSLS
jgi:hypothetical protein